MPAVTLHALEIPSIFSDRMVLQRNQELPIWGQTSAHTSVSVQLGKTTVEGTSDADGAFMLRLPPQAASITPQTLTISTETELLTFQDVLIGEVWLASGQSNMQWNVGQSSDADIEILSGHQPLIRLYQVDHTPSPTPRKNANAQWQLYP